MQLHRRIAISIAVFATSAVILVAAVGLPSMFRIRALRDEIVGERQKIDRRYALRNYVRNSLAEIESARKELTALQVIAVREGDELDFITAVEGAAASTGVSMTMDLQTVNQQDISDWERQVPIKFEVAGQFPQVASFLNEMEHLPYYVILDSLLVTTPRRGGGALRDGSVEALFSGVVYWQSTGSPAELDGAALEIEGSGI